jgi:hypothetical protein
MDDTWLTKAGIVLFNIQLLLAKIDNSNDSFLFIPNFWRHTYSPSVWIENIVAFTLNKTFMGFSSRIPLFPGTRVDIALFDQLICTLWRSGNSFCIDLTCGMIFMVLGIPLCNLYNNLFISSLSLIKTSFKLAKICCNWNCNGSYPTRWRISVLSIFQK